VLQEREIMRIGDDKIIPIDVRIISATNRDLFQQTRNGSFRQDLYYRIHVFSLKISPLRERTGDISQIFHHYLHRFCLQSGRKAVLSPAAEHFLKTYAWPGNIRQLRNVAEVVAYSESVGVDTPELCEAIGDQNLDAMTKEEMLIPNNGTLKEIEAMVIRNLMSRHSTGEVCTRLGISRATLWRKLQRLPAT
jgi:transcriptional regulator with PAS, ATPase and Fis domain